MLCRSLYLLDAASVAIDGSKFKAANHREKNFKHDRLTRRIAAVEGTIDRYLAELDRADRQHEATGVPVRRQTSSALSEVSRLLALHVLAYNLKRVTAILGLRELLRAM